MFSVKYLSPIGQITLTSDGSALTGLYFEKQKPNFVDTYTPACLTVFEETASWLDCYFNGDIPQFTPELDPQGTPFKQSVWNILKTIPWGKTMTYGEIAKIIAKKKGIVKMSAQAVGTAVGHNPISIIIPCHRVVGANRSLVGYTGGIELKRKLLEIENFDFHIKDN